MRKVLWTIILIIGICPLVLPVVSGIYMMSIQSWSLSDWLIMYSFLYWPTYIAGLILTIISILKLRKHKKL